MGCQGGCQGAVCLGKKSLQKPLSHSPTGGRRNSRRRMLKKSHVHRHSAMSLSCVPHIRTHDNANRAQKALRAAEIFHPSFYGSGGALCAGHALMLQSLCMGAARPLLLALLALHYGRGLQAARRWVSTCEIYNEHALTTAARPHCALAQEPHVYASRVERGCWSASAPLYPSASRSQSSAA